MWQSSRMQKTAPSTNDAPQTPKRRGGEGAIPSETIIAPDGADLDLFCVLRRVTRTPETSP